MSRDTAAWPKYRHYLYEWLGVDKVEMAVMTELLLRGDQTVGELRGRAARMEPISDLSALRPVLDSLKSKGLVVSLTPEGRGHAVTHALYKPRELEAIRAKYQAGGAAPVAGGDESSDMAEAVPAIRPSAEPFEPATPVAGDAAAEGLAAIRRDLADLRGQVAQMRSDLDEVRSQRALRLSDEVPQFEGTWAGNASETRAFASLQGA